MKKLILKNLKTLILILLFIFVMLSCKDDDEHEKIDKNGNKHDVLVSNEIVDNDFFNIDNKIKIVINISDEQLRLIQDDYDRYSSIGSKSPIYRMCDLSVTINEVEYFYNEVGIRMKGNTSRVDFYDNEIYNLIHFKLSFSETFDSNYYETKKVWTTKERVARKNRTFGGLEKLDLKWNKNFDSTLSREIFTYDLFRKNGLFAPRATVGNLCINIDEEESLGMYIILENVDEGFIERNLNNIDQGGDLYKVGWGFGKGGTLNIDTIKYIGVEDEDKGYFPVYDLKTNKKTSNNNNLINLINSLNSINFKESISNLVDISYFTKYMAVSYVVGNPDDIRYHYNNYYIYFLKSNNKAIFIRYDYDRTLGITKDWNPSKTAMLKIDMYSLYTTDLGNQINPLIINTICKGGYYIEEYRKDILNIYYSDFFTIDNFKEYYNKIYSNYSELVEPTIDKLKDKYINLSLIESNEANHTENNYSVEKYFSVMRKYIDDNIDKYK